MAKFFTVIQDCFFGSEKSVIEKQTVDNKEVIEISFYSGSVGADNLEYCFFLDKSSAIKFAKTLRTEINKITESEVNNE